MPECGNLVKWEWFKTYDQIPPKAEYGDRIVQSWDTAMTAHDGSDWSVCTTWVIRGNHYYLVDLYRERLDFPTLKRSLTELFQEHAADTVLIEDMNSGTSLIQQLRDERQISPIPIKPEGSKADRMAAQSATIEAGQVLLPAKAPWLDMFRTEMLAFPHGKHDDQVDSVSQFLNWINQRKRNEPPIWQVEFFPKQSYWRDA